MEEYFFILSESELLNLLRESENCRILEAGGVDNWMCYGDAYDYARDYLVEEFPEKVAELKEDNPEYWFDEIDPVEIVAQMRLKNYKRFIQE